MAVRPTFVFWAVVVVEVSYHRYGSSAFIHTRMVVPGFQLFFLMISAGMVTRRTCPWSCIFAIKLSGCVVSIRVILFFVLLLFCRGVLCCRGCICVVLFRRGC